jgi:hypothetical protein
VYGATGCVVLAGMRTYPGSRSRVARRRRVVSGGVEGIKNISGFRLSSLLVFYREWCAVRPRESSTAPLTDLSPPPLSLPLPLSLVQPVCAWSHPGLQAVSVLGMQNSRGRRLSGGHTGWKTGQAGNPKRHSEDTGWETGTSHRHDVPLSGGYTRRSQRGQALATPWSGDTRGGGRDRRRPTFVPGFVLAKHLSDRDKSSSLFAKVLPLSPLSSPLFPISTVRA